jgi:hypothetical protein
MVIKDNQKVSKGYTVGTKGVIRKYKRGNQRIPK